MYKNQLQELAQRSCFNLPSYTCIREGPDHAPRFKATVNFNSEIFESPHYCSTLRQAEHSAAEVALNSLSSRGPSNSLAARILDETGVYKNLLQEIAQRVGAPLPQYTTYRSGLGHLPVFTGTVELAGIIFTGEPAKNKKQAEKNAAMAAWSSLKQLAKETASSSSEHDNNDELEQITIARALLNYRLKEKIAMSNSNAPIPFPRKFQIQNPRSNSPQPPHFCTRKPRAHAMKFTAAGATPYVPMRQMRSPCHGIAPPVTIRTAVPVFSAPPLPPSTGVPHQMIGASPLQVAAPVNIRQTIPVHAAPPVRKDEPAPIPKEVPLTVSAPSPQDKAPAKPQETDEVSAKPQEPDAKTENTTPESQTVQSLEQLKI
ncbi:hypothetical protein K1719_041835 [Acacia pycnantha]|nr:hypothetical protein K1719_041835 [Acacia pycnantha]